MKSIEFKTPNGYTALISADITYGQFTELQNTLTSKMVIDGATSTVKDVPATFLYEANQLALKMLLIKLIDPEGNELPDPANAIKNIPADDGIAIAEQINLAWQNSSLDKKKGTQ